MAREAMPARSVDVQAAELGGTMSGTMAGPLVLALVALVGVLVALGVIEWTRRW